MTLVPLRTVWADSRLHLPGSSPANTACRKQQWWLKELVSYYLDERPKLSFWPFVPTVLGIRQMKSTQETAYSHSLNVCRQCQVKTGKMNASLRELHCQGQSEQINQRILVYTPGGNRAMLFLYSVLFARLLFCAYTQTLFEHK